jgi:AraC-like DNA-binding protein
VNSYEYDLVARRLDQVENWETLAAEAHYRPSRLVENLQVSDRTLRRHFRAKFQLAPRRWAEQLRPNKAAKLLAAGQPPKTVALELGYKQLSHFSARFHRHFGVSPRSYAQQARNGAPTPDPASKTSVDPANVRF